ncbi:MAG: GatB/YqeY domain-containing protein [Lentisphaeria bacterium]|nr:GatB/YqeY domain-containing protein [Lentisphaeria bacterium]
MSLVDQVTSDLKDAMRNRETVRLDAIRALRGEIIMEEKKPESDLSDEHILKIIKTLIKQRRESISQFSGAGRDDLVEKEQGQIDVLAAYLPEALTEDELGAIVDTAIAETGASSMKEMGTVMKAVMVAVGVTGKDADGKTVSSIVKAKLQ